MTSPASQPIIIDLAEDLGVDPGHLVTILRKEVMPEPCTDAELLGACMTIRSTGLNPIQKEIYFARDAKNNGAIQALTGIDGWSRICNRHPQYDGVTWREKMGKDGLLVWIEATIHRKDRSHPTSAKEYMRECRPKEPTGGWATHPNRVLRHRAYGQCGRLAFEVYGLMDQDEFRQWQGVAADAAPRGRRKVERTRAPKDIVVAGQQRPLPPIAGERHEETKPVSGVEAARVLEQLSAALASATPATRPDIIDGFEQAIDALDPASRRAAERLIEGREVVAAEEDGE